MPVTRDEKNVEEMWSTVYGYSAFAFAEGCVQFFQVRAYKAGRKKCHRSKHGRFTCFFPIRGVFFIYFGRMKMPLVLSASCTILMASCEQAASGGQRGADEESTREYCFQKIEGNNGKDTTRVSIIIDGQKVYGKMDYIPFEKDARRGNLSGTIVNNKISAVWTFMQEGRGDTLNLLMELKDDFLVQKPLIFDDRTGREQTNQLADYSIKMPSVACQ